MAVVVMCLSEGKSPENPHCCKSNAIIMLRVGNGCGSHVFE